MKALFPLFWLTLLSGPAAMMRAESPPPAEVPAPTPSASVRLVGANGREVDFAGVWEARPEGLLVLTAPEAAPAVVPWERFDLDRLRVDQPAIEAARRQAVFLRSPQPLNLGLFAGMPTPAQAGAELRRALDVAQTVKVPLRYRTTTTSSTSTSLVPARPVIYGGLVIPPLTDAVVEQNRRTVTETRVGPDELTTTPRRVLAMLSRTEGVAAQDRRELLDLVRTNPALLEDLATEMERIAASLPPRHLLPNEPTVLSFGPRLRDYAAGLRALTVAAVVNYADQIMLRDLLELAESSRLR